MTHCNPIKALYSSLLIFGLIVLLAMPVMARSGGSLGGRSGFSSSAATEEAATQESQEDSSERITSRTTPHHQRATATTPRPQTEKGETSGGGGGMAIIIILIVIALIVYAARKSKKNQGQSAGSPTLSKTGTKVARLSVAYYATERTLQKGLDNLARSGRGGTPADDAWLLRQAALLMASSNDAAIRLFYQQESLPNNAKAEGRLEDIGMDLRSRFSHESIRADDGQLRELTIESKSDAIAEYVVVTLAVAFRGEPLTIKQVSQPEELKELVLEIGKLGVTRLLGMEIIWDPATPEEALRASDMDQHYPDLSPL